MATRRDVDAAHAKLREAGFDPAGPPGHALETLRSLRGTPGISETVVAHALGNLPLVEAADLLAEMEPKASGAERREIRRSLFKLRQRGIAPSVSPALPKQPASAAAEPSLSALLSSIDTEGTRLVWIVKPRAQGGLSRLSALTSETEGLVGARVIALSRRELREDRGEIELRSGLKLVEADWKFADFVLCEAFRRTPESRRAQAGDFLATRAEIIAAPPPADFVHPVYAELPGEPTEPAAELLKEPEISGWKLPADDIKPYVEEVNELQQSPLLLNKLQQQDRVEAVVEKAVGELLAGERGQRIRRRLEDTAYYLARTGRERAARWAVAAAAAIRDGAGLKRKPFFRSFVGLQLGTVIAEEEAREKEEPRLIVTPAEAARQSRTRGRPG